MYGYMRRKWRCNGCRSPYISAVQPTHKGRLLTQYAQEREVDNQRLARDVVYHARVASDFIRGLVKWDGAYVHAYVRQQVAYVEDVDPENQRLRMPWKTLEEGAGDCKSTAILIAGLAKASKRKAVIRFVDQRGEGWDHVYAVVDGVAIDPLLPYGEEVPHLFYHDTYI